MSKRSLMAARKVEATVEIPSPPEEVIPAFMESGMLRDWWGVERQESN